jgi:hypothetical protein
MSHIRHVFKVLERNGIPYETLVVDNNIERIDCVDISKDDYKLIKYDKYVRLNQDEIDKIVTSMYPKYWERFKNIGRLRFKATCLNAMRASFIEQTVSSNISSNYDRVIAFSSDFQFRTDMPVNDIIHMDHNDIILSNMNHGDGYTDGLYIGTPHAVKLCMNHLDIIEYSYEYTIKKNIERYNINAIIRTIKFSKIRADLSVFGRDKRLEKKIKNCHDDNYKQLLEFIKSND